MDGTIRIRPRCQSTILFPQPIAFWKKFFLGLYICHTMAKPKKVHLLTGANLGDCPTTLAQARQLLEERVGPVIKASKLYETAPWGDVDQPNYLNQALEMETNLSPAELLKTIKTIEKELGRTNTEKWKARIIDIDVLFYAHLKISTPELTIPHAHIHRRNFVLIPLMEIAPLKKHPVLGKTIEELYLESEDELDVMLVEKE